MLYMFVYIRETVGEIDTNSILRRGDGVFKVIVRRL